MPSNIHKRLVFGALGCGGLLVVVMAIGFAVARSQLFTNTPKEVFTPEEAQAAWDTLVRSSVADSLSAPALSAWSFTPPVDSGTLVIGPSRIGDFLPSFGDTFPPGAKQREDWDVVATRVSVRPGAPTRVAAVGPAGSRLFEARALFAAAEVWGRSGRLGAARLAIDSALGLARSLQVSGALERQLVGARIERDAMDLLRRHSNLAGGVNAADLAAVRLPALDRYVARLRRVDHLLNIAGSSADNVGYLGDWVADSTLPLGLRTAAVRAIVLGWVSNATEPGLGIDPVRAKALQKLRAGSPPDSVAAAIDRAAHVGDSFTARIRVSVAYHQERLLLYWP